MMTKKKTTTTMPTTTTTKTMSHQSEHGTFSTAPSTSIATSNGRPERRRTSSSSSLPSTTTSASTSMLVDCPFHGSTTTTTTTTTATSSTMTIPDDPTSSTNSNSSCSRSVNGSTKNSKTSRKNFVQQQEKRKTKQLYFWNTTFGPRRRRRQQREHQRREHQRREHQRRQRQRQQDVSSSLLSSHSVLQILQDEMKQQQSKQASQSQKSQASQPHEHATLPLPLPPPPPPLDITVKIVYCTGRVHEVVSTVLNYQYNSQHQYHNVDDCEDDTSCPTACYDGTTTTTTSNSTNVTCLVLHGPITRRTVMALNQPLQQRQRPQGRQQPAVPAAASILRTLCLHEATLLNDDEEEDDDNDDNDNDEGQEQDDNTIIVNDKNMDGNDCDSTTTTNIDNFFSFLMDPLCYIQHLDLSKSKLNTIGVTHLVHALQHNTSLTTLTLNSIRFVGFHTTMNSTSTSTTTATTNDDNRTNCDDDDHGATVNATMITNHPLASILRACCCSGRWSTSTSTSISISSSSNSAALVSPTKTIPSSSTSATRTTTSIRSLYVRDVIMWDETAIDVLCTSLLPSLEVLDMSYSRSYNHRYQHYQDSGNHNDGNIVEDDDANDNDDDDDTPIGNGIDQRSQSSTLLTPLSHALLLVRPHHHLPFLPIRSLNISGMDMTQNDIQRFALALQRSTLSNLASLDIEQINIIGTDTNTTTSISSRSSSNFCEHDHDRRRSSWFIWMEHLPYWPYLRRWNVSKNEILYTDQDLQLRLVHAVEQNHVLQDLGRRPFGVGATTTSTVETGQQQQQHDRRSHPTTGINRDDGSPRTLTGDDHDNLDRARMYGRQLEHLLDCNWAGRYLFASNNNDDDTAPFRQHRERMEANAPTTGRGQFNSGRDTNDNDTIVRASVPAVPSGLWPIVLSRIHQSQTIRQLSDEKLHYQQQQQQHHYVIRGVGDRPRNSKYEQSSSSLSDRRNSIVFTMIREGPFIGQGEH